MFWNRYKQLYRWKRGAYRWGAKRLKPTTIGQRLPSHGPAPDSDISSKSIRWEVCEIRRIKVKANKRQEKHASAWEKYSESYQKLKALWVPDI